MEKDECDSFIEEAEQIVQLFEEGYDVSDFNECTTKIPILGKSTNRKPLKASATNRPKYNTSRF